MEVCEICYNFDVENAFFRLENVKKMTSVSSCCSLLEICASARSGCATCQILSDGLNLCEIKRWDSQKMHILLDVDLPLRIEFGNCGYDNQVEFFFEPGKCPSPTPQHVLGLIEGRSMFTMALRGSSITNLYATYLGSNIQSCSNMA